MGVKEADKQNFVIWLAPSTKRVNKKNITFVF